MARWRVVCVKRVQVLHPTPHGHTVGVGTGEWPNWADMRWRLDQVMAAMGKGDTFYTQRATDGRVSTVETYICPACGAVQIRSAGCGADEDDLEDLRECVFKD